MTQSVHEVLLKRFGPNQPNQGSVLADFKFERVLRIDSKRKLVCLQCMYNEQPAVLILEKNPFDEQLLSNIGDNFRYVPRIIT